MSKSTLSAKSLPPPVHSALHLLGEDIRRARKRRRISIRDMAERAMVSPGTIQRIEKGDASVGIGIMASVLWVLGLHQRFESMVAPETDSIGQREDLSRLPKRVRRGKVTPDDGFDF